MKLEQLEDLLATKEAAIRSKSARWCSRLLMIALAGASVWLAPGPEAKTLLPIICVLLLTILWLISRVAFHRKEIQRLEALISILQGTELDDTDVTVLRCVFEIHPERFERDELVVASGFSLHDISLSLRKLVGLDYLGKIHSEAEGIRARSIRRVIG